MAPPHRVGIGVLQNMWKVSTRTLTFLCWSEWGEEGDKAWRAKGWLVNLHETKQLVCGTRVVKVEICGTSIGNRNSWKNYHPYKNLYCCRT